MDRWLTWMALGALLAGVVPTSARADGPVTVDVLLKDAVIVDGRGGPQYVGNLGLAGGKIVAIGDFVAENPGEVLDCTGLVVCPGFIDLHNHSDEQIVTPEMRANVNFLTQGCTTIVTGNCGSGPTAVATYYDAIDLHGAGTNVAHLVPQGTLRDEVLGPVNRTATTDELQRMRAVTQQAMQDGAWGMSTGLIYVPSVFASTDELVALAEVVGNGKGIYVSHIRGEGRELLASVHELLEIGRRAQVPVHLSHFKASGQSAWGLVRPAAEQIEFARRQGQVVTADQYPYTASSTSLDATVIPTWGRAGGEKELLARFDDPQLGPRLRSEIVDELRSVDEGARVRFARFPERPQWMGRSVADVAAAEGQTPLQIVEFVSRHGGASIVNFCMHEDDVRFVMALPWVATASDGRATLPGPDRPHPRFYGTFPRKIGYYALQERVLTLEQAIRSATGLPAEILGLRDRGRLELGLAADVCVFDPQSFIDTATFDDPHQNAVGIRAVFVNGTLAVWRGQPTGALAGRALRHVPNIPETPAASRS